MVFCFHQLLELGSVETMSDAVPLEHCIRVTVGTSTIEEMSTVTGPFPRSAHRMCSGRIFPTNCRSSYENHRIASDENN